MKWKKAVTILTVFLLILAALYVAGMYFFASHYTYGTYIGGKDFSFKSKNAVYREYPAQTMDFVIELIGRDDMNLEIDSKSVAAKADYDLSGLDRYNGNLLDGLRQILPGDLHVPFQAAGDGRVGEIG